MTSHQWEAEQLVEPETALRLIQKQFPELQAQRIKLLGAGWDNTAFVVNEVYIFRFPRRKIALPFLETEWNLLPSLASKLPIPIPVPQWKGIPEANFPWPFIGYKILLGRTACHANLSEEERTALAEPIAQFLKILHQISNPGAPEHLTRINGVELTQKIQKNFGELSKLGLLFHKKELERVVMQSQSFRPPRSGSLVHGDFYVRHLLVNDRRKLVGVIDWGDMHFGDPAIDLAIAHSFLPQEAHDLFRKAYGQVEEDTWHLARLRAIFSSTYLTLFGHHSGDKTITREGLRALKMISLEAI